jgi:hypothetical protein
MSEYQTVDSDEYINPVQEFEKEDEGIIESIKDKPIYLWEKYKRYILIVLLIILVAVGIYFFYKDYKQKQNPISYYYLGK